MEPIFKKVAAQWYDRTGTLRACAEQVLDFLIRLRDHNPAAFGAWYIPAKTKKQALESRLAFTYEGVKKVMTRDIKKGDLYIPSTEGKFYPQEGTISSIIKHYKDELYTKLAYDVNIWNGLDSFESGSLSITVGSPYGNRYWSNNCIVYLPKAGPTHAYYQIPANQQALIELLEDCWQPDYIEVNGERI